MLAALAALAVGCGVPGADAIDELARHLEASTQILETHRDRPEEALRALAAYQEKHADTLITLEKECHSLRQSLSAAQKHDLAQRWAVAAQDLVMVGDYRFDLECAQAAGARGVLVNLPDNPWPELTELHAQDCAQLLAQLR